MTNPRNEWRRALWFIFLPALVLRLGLAFSLPADDTVFADAPYQEYARNFSEGKGFWMSKPYLGSLGIEQARAFRPPLFPLLWGCVYRATNGAYAPIRAAHAILGALTCLLAWLLAREIIPRPPIPLITGMLCAVYPPLIWHSVHLMTEPLFIFLGALTIYALVRSRRAVGVRWLILAAVAAALATLTRSVLVLFLPVICLWLWWAGRWKLKALIRVIIFTAVVTTVMAPWIIRNAIVLHAFVPTTTDAGHGFHVANNPRALGSASGFHTPEDWRFILRPGEQTLDEVTAYRRLMRHTAGWLIAHPATAARLMARRFITFWRFYPNPEFIQDKAKIILYASAYIPLFILMFPGAWILHRNCAGQLPALILIDALILYYTVVHTAVLAMMRYRVPLMPFLLIFSATALAALYQKLRSGANTAVIPAGTASRDE